MTSKKHKVAVSGTAWRQGFFVALAFFVLLIYSKNSPLYFTNNWVDPNAYLTLGRGILQGLVPYRDLFEQKGPLLYFIHALAALIGGRSFFGVFLIETVLLWLNLNLFYRITRHFTSDRVAFLACCIFPLLFVNHSWFSAGDSAEEFAFPALLYLIFLIFTKIQKREILLTFKDFFVQGLLVACLFWIKFTLTGAWIGFFGFVFISFLVKKSFRRFGLSALAVLGGFLTVTLPILFYFAVQNSLSYLYDVYFKFNMTSYAGKGSAANRLAGIWGVITTFYSQHPIVLLLSSAGIFLLLIFSLSGLNHLFSINRARENSLANWIFLATFAMTVLGQFYGGRAYGYYLFVLIPYAAVGLIGFALLLSPLKKLAFFTLAKKYYKMTMGVGFILALLLPFPVNSNILYSRLFPRNSEQIAAGPNSDPGNPASAQQQFAKIIDKVPHATLLNYAMLDFGFYLAANKLPSERYFELQNIDYSIYPENYNAQTRAIQEGRVDFVVTPFNATYFPANYRLVAYHTQDYEGGKTTFYLYQKNPKK